MYINTETLQYPVSENWIRKNAPNTSFTEDFTPPAPFKAVKATINNLDFNPITQRIEQSFPENRGGEWFQTWNVVDKYATKEEADKGSYKHYMLKEIMEEPMVLARTLNKYINNMEDVFDVSKYNSFILNIVFPLHNSCT